ncbi:MAG: beta galactosidase jelly roll domain-containing protein [Lachnospiraceae bacterium]|nr:beta galactosidase jelly roll domain-containing protein [Lachnospiraceae bacterium]
MYKKDYPRPQLMREEWKLLNGEWKFCFDDDNTGERKGWNKGIEGDSMNITVPFTYETKMSGIGEEKRHDFVWYERKFDVPEEKIQKKMLLHFEGVDYVAKVFVNGVMVGTHKGAYARFSFDISPYIRAGENTLVVKAEDSFSPGQPRGKQRWKNENFGCWYVQTTGIWKSVWIEYVEKTYIKEIKTTPDMQNKKVVFDILTAGDIWQDGYTLEATVRYKDMHINSSSCVVATGNAHMEIFLERMDLFEWGIFSWNCEHPDLYDVDFKLKKDDCIIDEVYSYFGMREIKIECDKVLLNGEPLYQRLILDQGYWKNSHLTPPDEEALIKDIDAVLAMGYNGVRKHQKTEDERFLYWCDHKGLLVWSEVGAAYRFDDDAVEDFTNQWMEIVRQNYSHPSIITWTPFNESWGIGAVKNDRTHQHFTEAVYHLTKCFDPYRPVIVNDGWEHTCSDIITLHDYEESGEVFYKRYTEHKDEILAGDMFHCGFRSAFAKGFEYKGQPVIISEFGGIAFNEDGGWGYGNKVKDEADFVARFDSITGAIKKLPYVCGFCYTQVSDVQQEINGLLDEERNFKIKPEIIKAINTKSNKE